MIRSSYTVTFWHTAVENRIATVHGRKTIYFNGSTARISAHNSTERMRTISPRSFFLENVLYYPLTNEIVNGPMSLSHQDKKEEKIRRKRRKRTHSQYMRTKLTMKDERDEYGDEAKTKTSADE